MNNKGELIGGKYLIVISNYQFEWIKSLKSGMEELKRAANIYDLYIQDYGKERHKVIVNKKGELELL